MWRCFNKEKKRRAHDDTIKPVNSYDSTWHLILSRDSHQHYFYFILLFLFFSYLPPMMDRETIAKGSAWEGSLSRIVPSNKPPVSAISVDFSRLTSPSFLPFSFSILRYIIRKTRGLLVQEIARPWPFTAVPRSLA